jgi:type 1 glutamine amidotransferase
MRRFLAFSFLLTLSLFVRRAAADDAALRPIFDGKTLHGWDGDPRLWRVEDGAITGQTTKENPAQRNTFLIWRGGRPADFELTIEFRMPDAGFANSGVQFRSWQDPAKWGKWGVAGYQADMNDDDQYTGNCYGENYRGILAERGQKVRIGPDHKPKVLDQFAGSKELLKAIKQHGWNRYDIIARGNHIIQKINGELMCELTDEDTVARRDGILALQLHAGEPMKVQFRNIRLRELPKPGDRAPGGKKKIVFLAGSPSHGYAEHEYHAGCLLLAKCLAKGLPEVETIVCDQITAPHNDHWPRNPKALENADALVIFSDGYNDDPILPYFDQIGEMMRRGAGLACIHYGLVLAKGKQSDALKDWIGGVYNDDWSVNPFWTAEFKQLPEHPITRGVRPFTIRDEWYYHMRFLDNMEGVAPILTAVPPDETRQRPFGPHTGNPTVRARMGMPEVVAWARVRPDGGRGFGFTGGHTHWNWANRDYRTLVLNGIAWVAKIEVPPGGVPSANPTLEELEANQDKPQPPDFDREKVRQMIEAWK